jgi:hypothetical protein
MDAKDIKILSLGAIWNFGKGPGLSWAATDFGAQRSRL